METVTVMTPYLPDEERAQRLARLREGEQELTDIERRVLETAKSMNATGAKAQLTCNYSDRVIYVPARDLALVFLFTLAGGVTSFLYARRKKGRW